MLCRDPCRKGCCGAGSGEGGKLEGLCAPCLRHSESPSPQLLFTGVKETLVQPLHYKRETWASEGGRSRCVCCRVRGDSMGCDKFIFIFWGRWMLKGGLHTEKWVLSLSSSHQLSGPLGLGGNVLITGLGRDPWWHSPEGAMIDEGVTQLLHEGLVSIVLCGSRWCSCIVLVRILPGFKNGYFFPWQAETRFSNVAVPASACSLSEVLISLFTGYLLSVLSPLSS